MRFVQGVLQYRARFSVSRCGSVRPFAVKSDGEDSIAGTPKQGTYEKLGIALEQGLLKRELPESSDVLQNGGQGAGESITEEELKQRKSSAVRAWMESQVGRNKVEVAQILKEHNVLVRGGPEQGTKLMDALVAWKNQPTS